MNVLSVKNPFCAPVYYKDAVTSTMDEARKLPDAKDGTVIAAGEQTAGRGRAGRPWKTAADESLSFTVLFRYRSIKSIPHCLTLRAGLAVSLAIEDFTAFALNSQTSPLAGRVLVKWPNDVMLPVKDGLGRKAVGILTEADGGMVYIGIGINIAQKSFPPELAGKACSIAQALLDAVKQDGNTNNRNDESAFILLAEKRFTLLEMILCRLNKELNSLAGVMEWRHKLDDRLFMKGQRVCFIPGAAEELFSFSKTGLMVKPEKTEGILCGIGDNGEIFITPDSGGIVSFATGEIKIS